MTHSLIFYLFLFMAVSASIAAAVLTVAKFTLARDRVFAK